MAHFRTASVATILSEHAGMQRVAVVLDDGSQGRAYVLTQLTAPVVPGDRVLCNTTAVALSLGTGGWHFVVANLSHQGFDTPDGGHIMKLRYTPMQINTGSAEEHLNELPDHINGMVVVACTLHSQVPLVVLGLRSVIPSARIAYLMTDGAALPITFSGIVDQMQQRDLLAAGTITCGHAFGGDLEAVGVASGLALARHVGKADVTVVGMGPGVVGTGHALGTTALEAAPILDTAAALGGHPVLCVRASDGDQRPRHQGVSHHTKTVLDLVRSRVDVPVPHALFDEVEPWQHRHACVTVADVDGGALVRDAGMQVTTMGRGPDDDPLFFAAAAAAGHHAGQLVTRQKGL